MTHFCFVKYLYIVWKIVKRSHVCLMFLSAINKMTNKNYYSVKTVPNSNRQLVERSKIYTSSTQIHDRLPFWLGAGTQLYMLSMVADIH